MTRGRAKRQAIATQTDELTAYMSTALSDSVRLSALVASYLTVTEIVGARRVSRQWHQLFSQAHCGTAGWTFNPTIWQYWLLAERTKLLDAVSPSLLNALGCHRNLFRSLPHLETLYLYNSRGSRVIKEMVKELLACKRLPLKRLVVSDVDGMTPAVLRALPSLQYLSDEYFCDSRVMHSWLEYSPPALRCYEGLDGCPDASQLPQLVLRCSTLEELSIDRNGLNKWRSDEEINTLLASCCNLTTLRITFVSLNADLADVLCTLPKLVQLDIFCASLSTGFMQRIPDLHAAINERLSRQQQLQADTTAHQHADIQIELDSHGDKAVSDWWQSVVRALPYCTRLKLLHRDMENHNITRVDLTTQHVAGHSLCDYFDTVRTYGTKHS